MLQNIRFMKVCLQQQYQDYNDLIWYAMVTNQHPISPQGDMSTFFLWDNMSLKCISYSSRKDLWLNLIINCLIRQYSVHRYTGNAITTSYSVNKGESKFYFFKFLPFTYNNSLSDLVLTFRWAAILFSKHNLLWLQ